ncbi:hypothetical protein ACJJTC_003914 [Scirpophaga incertulas]
MGGKAEDKRAPIKGLGPRFKNIALNNFRGILAILFIACILSWQCGKGKVMVQVLWLLMFWFFLVQPISVPCTALIPIFFLPMTGSLSTVETTRCYFNDNIALFIISSMVILLLNNSGFDRRLALYFMCSGDACQFAGKRLIFKCSTAAFFLSMFSNRLIVTSTIIQYVTPVFMNLKTTAEKSPTEPNYDELRYILNNAIQTSSAIGSTAIMHSAYATLAFRTIWAESAETDKFEYPDIFNYLQYSFFAFPVAVVMFVLNFAYHMILMEYVLSKPMSQSSMNEVRNQMLKYKESIPEQVTCHEKMTVFFKLLLLLVLFTRWYNFGQKGWSTFNQQKDAEHSPVIKDVTVCAIFVLFLHIFPRTFTFLQFFLAEKRSDLKVMKPESTILFWRFVDKNTNYGYFILLGAGVALELSIRKSGISQDLSTYFGKNLTNIEWKGALFLVCLITSILANAMTSVATVVTFLPFVLNVARSPAQIPWQTKAYLPAVGVGIAASFGFMTPFLYTPAYFCHNTGKVPIAKMAKYSIISVLICCIVLWLALCFWGPFVWDMNDDGIVAKLGSNFDVTTPAASDGGGDGDSGAPAAPAEPPSEL